VTAGVAELGQAVVTGAGGLVMLEISLLGEQRVVVDDSVVAELGSPRAMALLGFLLLHRDAPQRREYIAAQFWPDSTDTQARTNLRRELHALRAGLPQASQWLVAEHGTLLWRLDAGCRLDVADFETAAESAGAAHAAGDQAGFRDAAAAALRAYRGELMPALYDDWVSAERERLHRKCVALLDQLIVAERSAQAYGEAIERARWRIDLEPLEEAGYRTLLQLQAQSGDRAAALQTYHRLVSVLERELGVAPDPVTTAEYERLVSQRPVARAEAGPATGAAAPPIAPVPAPGPLRLIGREREFRLLHGPWQRALQGAAGFAVLAGDAGVGKTRLLDELCALLQRDGAQVMRARCFQARGRLALAPVSEWLRSPAMQGARGQLDPVWANEVDRLVPRRDGGPATPPRPIADAWQRHRFFEGLARAVLSTGRPVLLVLDDLQWCDEDTLAWLQLLLHLGRDDPLLIVAATRRDEMDGNAELTEMLRVLRSAGQVTEVTLAPLDAGHSAELASAVLGSRLGDPEAGRLYAATGGYPLFVIESVRAGLLSGRGAGQPAEAGQPWPTGPQAVPATSDLPGPGPRVHAVLLGRIRQAAAPARAVAELAAVIGRDFTLELLTEASDLDSDVVLEAVDELWRRRIIREQAPASYDFFHDLLRDTAYQEISPPRRRLLHRRVAQALELIHADDPGAAAAAIAYQYERADRPARAVPHHVRAAEVATAVFANQKAVRHYQRAAELLRQAPAGRGRDRSELAIRNSMAAPLTAQYGYASAELQAVLERARDLADGLGDSRVKLLSLVGLFAVRFVQGHVAECYDIAQRSLELSHLHPDVMGQAHFAVAGAATSLARHQQSLPHFALAHELCSGADVPALVGTRVEVHGRAWSAHAFWHLGRDEEALHWCNWAISRAEDIGHPYSLAVALSYAAMTHQFRRDVPQTLEFARRVQEICARYDFAYYGNWGLILAGWCTGGRDGAEQIRAGLGQLRDQGAMARHPYYLALLAETLMSARQPEAAGAVLESARAAAAVHDDRWWLPELYRLDGQRTPGPAGVDLLGRAVAIAEEQGSQALLRRAADALAGRLHRTGTNTERSANAPPPTLPAEPSRSRPAKTGSNHDHDRTTSPL
jgi:DNA-binding SARP family transcriptional activator